MACVEKASDSQHACNHWFVMLSRSADGWLEKARMKKRYHILIHDLWEISKL